MGVWDHKMVWLTKYSDRQAKCCDPFNAHKKNITKLLREITSGKLNTLPKYVSSSLIIGNKLCLSC